MSTKPVLTKTKKNKHIETVRHPYELTANFVKWKFTPGENRIVIRILQDIKLKQYQNIAPQINFDEQIALKFYYKDLMLEGVNDTVKLRKDIQNLREKSFYIPYIEVDKFGNKKEKERLTGVINMADYDKGSSEVVLYLDDKWYKFLLNINSYTEYHAPVAFKLNSSYSIKMYYFVCHWFDNGGHTLSLESFRREFDISPEKYKTKTASRFKERILKPAKELLDKVADRSFNYAEIKQGRSIVGFSFTFYETNNSKATLINWNNVNKFLDAVNKDFKIDKIQRSRIAGLIKKYSFPSVKHLYMMEKNLIHELLNKNDKITVVDAIERGLKMLHVKPAVKEIE